MSSNTDLVGCHSCKGRKTLVGLGSIEMTCDTCKGIGWLEIPSKSAEDEFLLVGPNDMTLELKSSDYQLNKKKPGRPPKNKDA